MAWTNEIPKRCGWYWWRADESSVPVIGEIRVRNYGRGVLMFWRDGTFVNPHPGQWWDVPIKMPRRQVKR
jgi:hypothetical protein